MKRNKKLPKRAAGQLIPVIRGSVNTFSRNPTILIPFLSIAFVQLLALEILYFAPRYPLSIFFNPLIRTLWGGRFIHYPSNFLILPKLFQNIQVPIYIFLSSFFICVAISIISTINSGHKTRFLSACKETLKHYVHIFSGALIIFFTYFGLHKIYSLAIARALKISSLDGIFFIIKKIVLSGSPYINLLIGTFVTTIFAYIFPIIIIENRKIISAIGLNFKFLWGSFWYTFFIILIPTLFYLPVLLLRHNIGNIGNIVHISFPEVRFVALVISVIVTMFIDVTVYTAITTFYLLKKGH